MAKLWTAIGSISGTSMDGIDVSILTTDGEAVVTPGPGQTVPYPVELRSELLAFLEHPVRAETEPLVELERAVTDAHVQAIEEFILENRLDTSTIDLVGMHGQTVWHRPEKRFTRQLGLGAVAAAKLGIDTVTRFRHADVAAGGQGAPFAPVYHKALAAKLGQPLMVLNLGGVANVTYIDGETVIAFDTGPASALIDDWMTKRRGVAYDEGGRLAASGQIDRDVLARLMDNPYFAASAPKSLDRQDFHARAAIVSSLSDADGAATLAAFTIETVAGALDHVPGRPVRWLATGGGRLNRTFMDGLQRRLGVPVEPVEAVGWNGDFLEAQLFGYLAVRSVLGLPLSLPTTTGAPRPTTGGELFRA